MTPAQQTHYLRLAAMADDAGLAIHHTFRNRTCTIILRDLKGVAQTGVSIPYLGFEASCRELIATLRGEV